MKTGTTEIKQMRAKKTGRIHAYEVYTATDGTVVARLVKCCGEYGEWSEPFDNYLDATRDAARKEIAKTVARRERDAEYYRSGGY